MKRLLVFGLLLALLTGCSSKPPYTDNGKPGQIKAVVFYDDNKNGTMDSGEKGAQAQVAISQDASCPPSSEPKLVNTDPNGVYLFTGLKPGRYCVFPFSNGLSMTTKMTLSVYVSSDLVTTAMFGIVRE
jgi:hypothetical protein